MKIIIEHKNKKRKIKGAFNICGSKADLLILAKTIKRKAKNDSFAYGWIQICDTQKSIVNTPPLSWNNENGE